MIVALESELAEQIEVEPRRFHFFGARERSVRQRDHRESRRQHQRLLTAGNERIDAPVVHLLLEDADRSDTVYHQKHIAPARELGDLRHRMHRAGRSLAGLKEDRARVGIRMQRIFDLLGTNRAAPFDLNLMAYHAMRAQNAAPSLAELAAVDEDRVLARAEQVRDRGFHRAAAARGEQDDLLPRAHQRLHPLAGLVERRAELGCAMVDDRTRHFEQNFGWNRRRPGGEKIFFDWWHGLIGHQHPALNFQKKAWCSWYGERQTPRFPAPASCCVFFDYRRREPLSRRVFENPDLRIEKPMRQLLNR